MSLMKIFDELAYPHDLCPTQYYIPGALSSYNKRTINIPNVDLYPVVNGMELKADLPGINKAQVKLAIDQNSLTLSGERKVEAEHDEEKYHYAERRFGKFSRRLRLPYVADPSTVTARFENGILTVNIPRPETMKSSEILIE